MSFGTIIFLNGTSSAGKTTLAHSLQERLAQPYMHLALDQFRDGLPNQYRGLNAPVGTTGDCGLNVIPITDVEKPYTEIRFGTFGRQMLRGMRRAMAAMVENGTNIIIDDILLIPAFLDDYLRVFEPFKVVFVGVRCPRDIVNERERARPGRFPGTAIGHFEACHSHEIYDVEVDTSVSTPEQCAVTIIKFLNDGIADAFKLLRKERIKS